MGPARWWRDQRLQLRLLLLFMVLLQAGFLAVRVRPYGADAAPLLRLLIGLSLAAGVAVAMIPEGFAERLSATFFRAAAPRRRAIASLLAFSAAVGVASVLTQQVFSWDEESVLWAASVYAEGGAEALFARYGENAWLGPQHPPLVPILYGTVADALGPRLKLLRLANLGFGCGTVVVSYLIFEHLYERRTAFVAALVLLASPLFVRIASAASNDMPLTFLFCLAVLLALRLEQTSRDALALPLALTIGVGLLVKYTMLLVFPVLLALGWELSRLPLVRRHAPLVLAVSIAFLLAWIERAYSIGMLEVQADRLSRLAGMSTHYPGWALDAVLTKTPSALGVSTMPWLALGGVVLLGRRTTEDVFVLLWIALVGLPLLLTLPDNRYFLPAFPALALVTAAGLLWRPAWTLRLLLLALLLCAVTLALYASIDLEQKAFLFRRSM